MRVNARLLLAMLAVLGGCAQLPPAPPAPSETPAPALPAATPARRPAPANPLAATIQTWQERAHKHRASGDLASAARDWHVLTLLAPENESYREELAKAQAAIGREVAEDVQAGSAALRAGDAERASAAFLHALAADPENAQAAAGLREIDKRKLARIQADRAARVRQEDAAASARTARPAPVDNGTYDLEQGLEMFNAGDTAGGLRDLRAWVERHPQDRAARQRIGNALFERARELEVHGTREQALDLMDTAVALRGDAPGQWTARIQALRKALSNDYYERGTRAERANLPAAIKALETSLRYDPSNVKASARLAQARVAYARLQQIERSQAK